MDFYLGNYHSDLFQTCIGNTTVWKYFSNVFSIKLLALLKLPLRLTPMWKLHKILPNQHFTSLHQNFSWMENWIVWIMTRSMNWQHLISEACDDHEARKNWNFNWKFNLAVFSAKMEVCVSEKTGQGDSGEWCLNNKQCWEVLGKNWQIELLVAVAKFCRGSTIDNWQVHLRWHWCHQCLPMSTPSLSSSSSSSSFSS